MEPIAWTAVAMAVVSNMGTWIVLWKKNQNTKKSKRENPGNPHSIKLIQEHSDRLTENEGAIKSVRENLDLYRKENREDHQLMFAQIREIGNK